MAQSTPPTAPAAAKTTTYAFRLPTHGTLLVFGDSWTYGLYADPVSKGYAYLTAATLGLKDDVEGVGGTGYLNPGPGVLNGGGTYVQRLAKLPSSTPKLVIVQGSYNDTLNTAAAIVKAEESTLDAVKAKYPHAEIVVLGTGSPNPDGDNYTPPHGVSIDTLDTLTRKAAAVEHLNYVSPITEHWFTAAKAKQELTNKAHPHPSNYGHALFASKLVSDLRKLAG